MAMAHFYIFLMALYKKNKNQRMTETIHTIVDPKWRK